MPIDLRRLLAAAALLATALVGCSNAREEISSRAAPLPDTGPGVAGSGAPDPASPTRSTGYSSARSGAGAPAAPSDGSGAAGSDEAETFRDLAPSATRLGPEVQAFLRDVGGGRIDELAADSCGDVSPRTSERALGLSAFDGYDRLRPAERELLAREDWMRLFGALLGYFCPESLPDVALAVDPSGTVDDIGHYRLLVGDARGISAEAKAFAGDLGDDRIDELQRSACAATTAETSAQELGSNIVDSYDTDLTDGERASLGLHGYSELYGAMVGWFCPGNLPG